MLSFVGVSGRVVALGAAVQVVMMAVVVDGTVAGLVVGDPAIVRLVVMVVARRGLVGLALLGAAASGLLLVIRTEGGRHAEEHFQKREYFCCTLD